MRVRCSAAAWVWPRDMGSGTGVADGGALYSQAGVDVPDVVDTAAGVETGVWTKGRRRAALDESPLGGEEAGGAGAGLPGHGADEVRALGYTWAGPGIKV